MNRSTEGERLSKQVMRIKGCSRREAELYIEGGWVTVNGVVVQEPPFRVAGQAVVVDAAATLKGTSAVTLLLHKPPGLLDGTETDAKGSAHHKSSRTLLTLDKHWALDPCERQPFKRHLNQLEALMPLETGASGLLVFTQDWRTARTLRDEMGGLEHELLADVTGEVPPDALQRIARTLKDPRNPMPVAKCSVGSSGPERSTLRFAVKGAHPGLVGYLCETASLELLALRRIRLGRISLRDLPVGQWRYVDEQEKF